MQTDALNVWRVRRPEILDLPSVRGLVYEALATNSMVGDPLEALRDVQRYIEVPQLGLFVVHEGGRFVGAALAQLPTTALSPKACNVLHFFMQGSAEARAALVDAVVAYAREAGYDQLLAVDMNDRPEAFARLFRRAGAPSRVGQVFTFDLGVMV